ncbi:MAG: peptidoglycan DD-metalloendopeptidase family protein [Candidatus Nanopelagicales bacterium]
MRLTGRGARPRATLLVGAVLAALLALLAGSPAASPALADTIGDKINNAEDDLVEANAAVSAAMKQLEAARTQLPAARAAYQTAKAKLSGARQREAATARAVEMATAASIAAEQRVQEAQDSIKDMNGQITDLARAVYTQGPYAELAAVLSAKTPSEFADQLEAIRAVSRSQNKALADLQAAKADLALASAQAEASLVKVEKKRQEAAAALEEAAASAETARAAKAKIDALVAARANALAVADNQRDKVKAQYEALKKEQARLAALARARATNGTGFTGTPTGNLAWPIPGATTSGQVGWRVHPVYGYRSCHTGIDLSAGYGTAIRSAAAGKVVYVQNSGAYGLHTVIDHGGGIETMYAHQSSVAVSLGQIVSQGQVIGYVGSTGFSTGAHLHWEVHVNGVPYNPLGWFGGPKQVIACWNQV